MNNKKVFSVKLFWQSFKQLKAIGIICTVILFIFSVLPVVSDVISIETAKKTLGSAFEATYSYPQIVNAVENTSFLMFTFIIFAPLLALNCWKFLNKRSTSDFYHSLPYKRICLFLSKLAAVLAWLLVMYLISFASTAASYAIFSKYYIVDYYVIFRMYLAMFICCILCVAAISLACSFTGNMLTNVCMTGIILFLPRGLIYIISTAVAQSVYVMNPENVIPLLGNSANMITNIIFELFFIGSLDIQGMILSSVSNIYTLVLAIIYIAAAAVLFITRKSECAGKAAIGKASRFFIRAVICFSICAVMVLPVLCRQNSTNDNGSVYYTIISFIIAGVVLIVYECIQSKNIKSVMACLPAMAVSYVLTLFIGAVVDVGTAGILEYNPKMEDVSYIKLVPSSNMYNNYYSASGKDYFNSIAGDIEIEDKKIINEVCKTLESNTKLVKEEKIESIIYSNDQNKRCIAYDVYIKDGALGHNRKIYLSPEAIKVISENINNVESYKEAYLNLPDADSVKIEFYDADLSTEQKKTIYNTLLDEMKTIKFSDWYENVNSDMYDFSLSITFSRNGYIYEATIPLTDKLPKTASVMLREINASAYEDKELIDSLVDKLQKSVDGKPELGKYGYEELGIYINAAGGEGGMYFNLPDYLSQNPYIAPAVIEKIINEIKRNNYGENIDISKPYVRISYYCEDEDDIYKVYYVAYYVQLEGYDDISDYGMQE